MRAGEKPRGCAWGSRRVLQPAALVHPARAHPARGHPAWPAGRGRSGGSPSRCQNRNRTGRPRGAARTRSPWVDPALRQRNRAQQGMVCGHTTMRAWPKGTLLQRACGVSTARNAKTPHGRGGRRIVAARAACGGERVAPGAMAQDCACTQVAEGAPVRGLTSRSVVPSSDVRVPRAIYSRARRDAAGSTAGRPTPRTTTASATASCGCGQWLCCRRWRCRSTRSLDRSGGLRLLVARLPPAPGAALVAVRGPSRRGARKDSWHGVQFPKESGRPLCARLARLNPPPPPSGWAKIWGGHPPGTGAVSDGFTRPR